jgi:N-acetylglucosaminyl-diphospho-decaprenol L-rhamnosyltransferase
VSIRRPGSPSVCKGSSLGDVTLVIGNYEGAEFLESCIASARAQTQPPREIIVADGASSDRSRTLAAELGARVLPLANRGLGFLYNCGAEAATTEYVLLSNTDVVFDPDCFARLAKELDADRSLFAADPQQVDWQGEHIVHARTTLRRGRLFREIFPGLHLDHTFETDTTSPTVSAHGAAMLVRRSDLAVLGGFDETFFLDFEDFDLCWRAWLSGRGSVYVPGARLRHHVGGVTSTAALPRRLASSHHNIIRFGLKCLPARTAAVVIAGELLRLPTHPRAIAVGLGRVLWELPEILRERRRIRPSSDLLNWMLSGQPLR